MESWTFPPDYDSGYMPDMDSRYWFANRETMDPGARDVAILGRIREVMHYAYLHAPFYRNKWDQAGIHPDDIKSLEDFERVPVVTKAELRQSQESHPPFGNYLCIPEDQVHHIHGTSGTTGRPTAFAIGRRDWQTIANNQARVMWGMGLRPGDIVFIGSVFSLYMGSWGTLIGAERLRAKTFPFGAGATGMTARAAMWMRMTRPKAFYGTPSYALHLAETALAEGIEPKEFGLELLFFSGEPGASIPSVRNRIEALYGAQAIDCGTMAEMTPWMNAAGSKQTDGMLLWQDMVYTEVCDPKSHARVGWGKQGTPVYTHLERTSQPMIRLLSGDLTHWTDGSDNPCGRTYPRLPDGIYGRIDDMFTVRGENIYPSAIDGVLNDLAGYGGEHRIIITRDGAMDELLVRMDAEEETFARADEREDLRRRAEAKLGAVIGVRARVEIVAADTIERTDFKARRVIDDRDLFRSLTAGKGER
jgi:phenylacetate-CoA ligase